MAILMFWALALAVAIGAFLITWSVKPCKDEGALTKLYMWPFAYIMVLTLVGTAVVLVIGAVANAVTLVTHHWHQVGQSGLLFLAIYSAATLGRKILALPKPRTWAVFWHVLSTTEILNTAEGGRGILLSVVLVLAILLLAASGYTGPYEENP